MASNIKVDIVRPTATNGSLSLKGDSGGSATANGITVNSSGNTSITGTFTSKGIDDNASSTALTIDASGNVGIGATSMGATQKLLVKYIPSGDFTPVANNAYNHLTVQGNNNGYAGITISSPNTSNQAGGLAFADTSSGNAGMIEYQHNNDQMIFYTSDTQRMSIDSSGNVRADKFTNLDGTGAPDFPNGQTVADGAEATPSITNTDDTNTGIYFPAADTVGVSTGGTERMRIDSSGNVRADKFTNLDGTGAPDFPNGQTVADGAEATPSITNTGDTNTGIYFPAADTVGVSTGGTERMRIDSSGNLKFNSGYGSVATAYGCRAWVNFNGTGTVAIRASGNVSSITDNGTGDYTVNFATAMPDVNYCVVVSANPTTNAGGIPYSGTTSSTSTVSGASVRTTTAVAFDDSASVSVAIFH